jgi:A/G-specific adenine glycosylase
MLQRTKAQQVMPVYIEFTKKFPAMQSLGSAKRNEIKAFIERLGLYWRTNLIMNMIKELNSQYSGKIPDNEKDLRGLSGVGNYIADAVMVFAFGAKKTVIDANVIRLVTRYFGISISGEARRNKQFIRFCQDLTSNVPEERVKDFNWALIDLPSLICIRIPRCHLCPLSASCSYFTNDLKTRAHI